MYKEYAQSWHTCVLVLTFLILECGLVSKPVWVHWVDGYFLIEPVPDPFLHQVYVENAKDSATEQDRLSLPARHFYWSQQGFTLLYRQKLIRVHLLTIMEWQEVDIKRIDWLVIRTPDPSVQESTTQPNW